jgi:hypothetical protein
MEKSHSTHTNQTMEESHYKKLAIMAVLSFISMYILMYSMVNKFENVVLNINQFYMAGLMASPMIFIEVLLMNMMYKDKKLNTIIIITSVVALVGFFFAIRKQAGVSDKQFLKSMIPHHSGAILMCEQADIKDPEVKKLCEAIISSQRDEIAQMKAKLEELENK